MFGKKKLRTLSCSAIISLLLVACNQQKETINDGFSFSGYTQGTTYSIIIAEDEIHFQQVEIDSLLADFDTILSTYIPSSKISELNDASENFVFLDKQKFFKTCYEISQEVYKKSDGLYDPSVYSLVKAWGFFDKSETVPEKSKIDSILQFTGFQNGLFHTVTFANDSVYFLKKDPRFKLDFNGIAQGYSVDVLADFIESRGHKNYYIEIGGEIRVSGIKKNGSKWRLGIDVPEELSDEETREIETTVEITNCGMATSGNYRNFFEKDGRKYGHTLNAKTGEPIVTDVLSATVIAPNAALADAYATVFLCLGKEKSIDFLKQHPELKVILIYGDKDGTRKVFQS